MVDAWVVRGYRLPGENALLYAEARQRVLSSPRMSKFYDIILSDGYADDADHLRWVIRGRVSEIESWAKQIREDSDD